MIFIVKLVNFLKSSQGFLRVSYPSVIGTISNMTLLPYQLTSVHVCTKFFILNFFSGRSYSYTPPICKPYIFYLFCRKKEIVLQVSTSLLIIPVICQIRTQRIQLEMLLEGKKDLLDVRYA